MRQKSDDSQELARVTDIETLATQVLTSETSISLPSDLAIETWLLLAARIGRVNRCTLWWVGDMINYGEAHYGEQHSQGINSFSLPERTIGIAIALSKTFKPAERMSGLSWSHHLEVMRLPSARRKYWLERACAENLSTMELRHHIGDERPGWDHKPKTAKGG